MRTRHTATLHKLRLAVDCLPRQTRAAMLERIRSHPIIAGAYTSRDGICPMLAAHRSAGRADCVAFAKPWDAFAFRGVRRRRVGRRRLAPRSATTRELPALTAIAEQAPERQPVV